MHGDIGKGAREERNKPRVTFQDDASAIFRDAARHIRNQSRKHQLVANTLLGGDQQSLVLQRAAGPDEQFVIADRRLSGDLQPRRIIAPALFEIAIEQMLDRAVEPRLRVFGIATQGTVIQCQRFFVFAALRNHVGQIGQRRGGAGLERQRAPIKIRGRDCVAQIAHHRAKGEPQLRHIGMARKGRLQNRFCGLCLTGGS